VGIQGKERRSRKARMLLSPALAQTTGVWADLGCGDGVFTRLLAELLPVGSLVYAVDRDAAALRRLQQALAVSDTGVTVHLRQADFTHPLDLSPLDGMLLANSLHFVRHKESTMRSLVPLLKPAGRLVVIEYNTRRGNGAVPFPLPEEEFLALAATVGLVQAEIRTRAPSTFLGEMYTGVAVRPLCVGNP
jgi:trans-aconitate methyltransferase